MSRKNMDSLKDTLPYVEFVSIILHPHRVSGRKVALILFVDDGSFGRVSVEIV